MKADFPVGTNAERKFSRSATRRSDARCWRRNDGSSRIGRLSDGRKDEKKIEETDVRAAPKRRARSIRRERGASGEPSASRYLSGERGRSRVRGASAAPPASYS